MINPFSDTSYLLPPLGIFVTGVILVVVVLRKGQRAFARQVLCYMLVSVALTGLLLFGMRASVDVNQAVLWERAIFVVTFATFVFYYHFILAYTNTRGIRSILYVAYSFLIVAAILIPTDLIVERMSLEDYGYAPVIGPLAFPIIITGLFLVGHGIRNLVKRYGASSSGEERNRLHYLTVAAPILAAGILVDLLAPSSLPPVGVWTVLTFCAIATIVIVKYHLLDIRILIRKGLVYILVSAIIAIPYVGVLFLLNQVVRTGMEPWWAHVVIILVLAIILRPLYSWAQRSVDRLFYRDRYDYLMALEQFSKETQSIAELKRLGSTVVKLISGALRTSNVSLLLKSERKEGLAVVSTIGLDSPPSGVILGKESLLVTWLRLNGDIISSKELNIIPELQNIARMERQNLEKLRAELYVPIITRDGELSGLVILGEKLSRQAYTVEDKRLLSTIANQSAVTLENARLYEEAKHSEKALRESEEKLRLTFDSVAQGITVSDQDANIVQVNQAVLRMHGCDSKDELIGRGAFEFIAEKDRTEAMKNLKRTSEQGCLNNIEYTLLRKDGSEFDAELSTAVLRDASGNPTGFVAITQDISERKRAQERERRLQEQLNLSSRLASVGELAAGVAHEINNPLTGILGFSHRLLRKCTDQNISQDLKRIYGEAMRAAKVMQNLLTFTRHRQPVKQCSDINEIVQKTLELRSYELKTSNIEVVTRLAPGLPKTMVDFHQMQEVFLNIILNAEQVMTETNHGGKLSINTERVKDYVRISFADNGPGIPTGRLHKVFAPFFTLRRERGGTGLGLSVSHGIVTSHSGRIYAKSRPGKGATFFVELPVMTENTDEGEVKRSSLPEQSK